MDVLEFLRLVDAEYPGSDRAGEYKALCAAGTQRFGQAFMNVLRDTPYYNMLSGSLADPFYRNDYGSIVRAIEYVFAN